MASMKRTLADCITKSVTELSVKTNAREDEPHILSVTPGDYGAVIEVKSRGIVRNAFRMRPKAKRFVVTVTEI